MINLNPTAADLHHKLGYALASLERWDEAIAAYRQAIELHPNSGIVHYHLGQALANLGLDEQAISSLEKAIELKPDLSGAYQALENLQTKQKAI